MLSASPESVGRHCGDDDEEEVASFADAFWAWSAVNGTDDIDADLRRFSMLTAESAKHRVPEPRPQ